MRGSAGDLHFYMRHSFRPAPPAPLPPPMQQDAFPPRGRTVERTPTRNGLPSGVPKGSRSGLGLGRSDSDAARPPPVAVRAGARGVESSASSVSLTGASSLASSDDDEAAAAQLSGLYSELAGLVRTGALTPTACPSD